MEKTSYTRFEDSREQIKTSQALNEKRIFVGHVL